MMIPIRKNKGTKKNIECVVIKRTPETTSLTFFDNDTYDVHEYLLSNSDCELLMSELSKPYQPQPESMVASGITRYMETLVATKAPSGLTDVAKLTRALESMAERGKELEA